MAKVLLGGQTVPLEHVVLTQAFQLEALLNVLAGKVVIRKAEVQEGIMSPHVGQLETATTSCHRTAPLVMAVVFTAIVATGCAGGLAGSTAQVPCPAAIEAPVLYPGDTWTVRYEDGRRNRRTYGAERDGLLGLRYSNSDADFYYDHTHTLRKVYSKGQWVTAPTAEFWNIGKPVLEFPLTPGQGWVYTVPARDDSAMQFVRRYTVVRCEQVTVPAGTFVAVRIDASQIQANRPANAAMEWSQWYAPAVKYFVKQTSGLATFWTPVPGYELESFTIDAGKPATK